MGGVFCDIEDVTYDLTIHYDTLDMGSASGAAMQAAFGAFAGKNPGGAMACGYIDVRNHKTGEVVYHAIINRLKAPSSYSETSRLLLLYTRIGQLMAKDAKKEKKKNKK